MLAKEIHSYCYVVIEFLCLNIMLQKTEYALLETEDHTAKVIHLKAHD